MSGTVTQSQSGIRSEALGGDLMQVLTTAAQMANVDVTVFSGGQPSAAEPGERTGSTRHDHGNAADINLYQDGRLLSFTKADDRDTIASFVSAAVAAGATGIGAGLGYMGASGLHVGFGPNGVQGGPVTVWGAGGRTVNAPSWLSAAVAPGAVRGTVMAAQANLRVLGYLDDPVNGIMSAKTIKALNDYVAGVKGIPLSALPALADARRSPENSRIEPVFATDKPVALAQATGLIVGGNLLGKGNAGSAVREVQAFLNQRGVTDRWGQPLKEDTLFGPRTDSAVRAYQALHPELRVDGVVGPRTLAAMLEDQRVAEASRLAAEQGETANQARTIENVLSPADIARSSAGLIGSELARTLRGGAQPINIPGLNDPALVNTVGGSVNNARQDGIAGRTSFPGAQPNERGSWIGGWRNLTGTGEFKSLLGLAVQNTFAPAAVTDPYRLGGTSPLGGGINRSELITVNSAVRGAADALRAPLNTRGDISPGFGFGAELRTAARSDSLNLVGANFGEAANLARGVGGIGNTGGNAGETGNVARSLENTGGYSGSAGGSYTGGGTYAGGGTSNNTSGETQSASHSADSIGNSAGFGLGADYSGWGNYF